MIYGCRDWGNDFDEIVACTFMCSSISVFFANTQVFSSVANNYGPYTTQQMVLNQAAWNQQYYDWNTVFYVGHSQIDQISAPQHLTVYMNSHPTPPDLIDYQIYPNTSEGDHHFVCWWSCGSANYIGSGSPSPWQLAYCWTHNTQLSSDGYSNPWSIGNPPTCFIGFQYGSKPLSDIDPNGAIYNYADFVEKFYYYAVYDHQTLNDALDLAAKYVMGDDEATLGSLELKQGYYVGDQWSYIRVFGNGELVIPYT
ncbi:MAG: hypothetical protein WC325_06385 [Candidatus Bathyarchaeia archaeon]